MSIELSDGTFWTVGPDDFQVSLDETLSESSCLVSDGCAEFSKTVEVAVDILEDSAGDGHEDCSFD